MGAKHYLKLFLKICLPLLVLLLAVLLLPKLVRFFMPFILGYIVAFLANPLVTWLQRRISMKRKHSSIFITVLVLALVILLLYLILSKLLEGAYGIFQELPEYYNGLFLTVTDLFDRYSGTLSKVSPELVETLRSFSINLNSTISELLSSLASPTVSIAGSAVKSVPSLFINALIFILSAFCFITEWENIQSFIRKHTPKAVDSYITYLKKDLRNIFSSWLLAQFKIMFVVFAVLAIGFLLLKVRHAFLIAAITAFLDFLPAFGVGFVLWPWIALSLLQGKFVFALLLAVVYLATQVVRQVLQPKIMGETMGLPPLWTLFFLFVGNIKQLDALQTWIGGAMAGRDRLVGVLVSQVISNVPAAMLLSGYSSDLRELIVGVNVGGLGTLIASMASLISYKQVAGQYPSLRKRYLILFTLLNLGFLVLLYWI